ncbi:redoxin domain-containing protein [Prolixibacteraceae bacterium Z1-6]|uniref:Thioredoxin peroxidase n=1 Tax=Draconibacterium aestuarii TaxID=2998507 RepID=A0A9X3FAH3_9BACT|nr:redoxin domain-containing protein [Prolixibacteraceae bacterium Z1-6]
MKKLMLTLLACTLITGMVLAEGNRIPLIGSKAPSFTANSTHGELKFPNDFGKSWKILFSHPADFTPVCSSELLELANLQPTFDKLGVKIAIISTDNVDVHKMWESHLEELNYKNRGTQNIEFPLFEDIDGKASRMYGMLHEPVSTSKDIRGVFIIDDQNIVRSINFYPMQVGRNMEEIVRIVEALKTTDEAKVLTPANWEKGDDVMVPFFPYTKAQLAENPGIEKEYYNVGDRMWFKVVDEKK